MAISRPRSDGVLPWIVLGLVCLASVYRIATALTVPALTRGDPAGLFRTDPALIHYIASRIADNGGWPPPDFRADPRIESPELTDIPAMFTVGQEFLVAWLHLLLGRSPPFHLVDLCLMSVVASLTVVGIVGLARELTGSSALASAAGLLYVATPGSYRTLGYILLREDLSYPLFALHLYLLMRASRIGSVRSVVGTSVVAVAALSTWHAMTFVFRVEIACLFAWWLRTGESPFDERQHIVLLLLLAAGSLAVPVLLAKAFVLSLPMQLLAAMAVAPPLVRRAGRGPWVRAGISLLSLALITAAFGLLARWLALGSGDYAHVVEMMLAKVRHLGALPRDPGELSYDARLLWQGIFATGSPALALEYLGVLALLTPIAALFDLPSWWKGRGDARALPTTALASASLLLALLVERLISLAAILSPVVVVMLVRSRLADPWRTRAALGLVAVQAVVGFAAADTEMLHTWYAPETVRGLAQTIHYIRDELPDEGSIAADFVTSAALLAQTGHPVVLQPKYETTRSRRRIERFTMALYHENADEFRRILRRDFGARYLLIDAGFLWSVRYEAGLPQASASPLPGTAAYDLLTNDRRVWSAIPGYRLLYRSDRVPPRYRLYELLSDEDIP